MGVIIAFPLSDLDSCTGQANIGVYTSLTVLSPRSSAFVQVSVLSIQAAWPVLVYDNASWTQAQPPQLVCIDAS